MYTIYSLSIVLFWHRGSNTLYALGGHGTKLGVHKAVFCLDRLWHVMMALLKAHPAEARSSRSSCCYNRACDGADTRQLAPI
jgi:hypothetical protein